MAIVMRGVCEETTLICCNCSKEYPYQNGVPDGKGRYWCYDCISKALPTNDENVTENKLGLFDSVLYELRALYAKKSSDYGSGGDPLKNLRACAEFNVPAWLGCYVRINDKITRLKSFCRNGKLENESVEDSLRDIAVYSILALGLYRESATTEK